MLMMNNGIIEEWRDIEGFNGFYQVSNLGRVKSMGGWRGTAKRRERILKIHLTKDGYCKVRLTHKDKDMTKRVHQLVAMAFIPNPMNKETVNHIDGDKLNNVVTNLEWCTRSEQLYHAYRMNLRKPQRGSKNVQAKLTDEQVKEIRNLYVPQSREFGTVALGKKYNVSARVIGLIVHNKSYING